MNHPIAGKPVERCTGCGGALVAFLDLPSILDAMAPELPPGAGEQPMEPVAPKMLTRLTRRPPAGNR